MLEPNNTTTLLPFRNNEECRLMSLESRLNEAVSQVKKESISPFININEEGILFYVGERKLSPNITNLLEDIGYQKEEITNPNYVDTQANIYTRNNGGNIDILVEECHDFSNKPPHLTYFQVDQNQLKGLKKDIQKSLIGERRSKRKMVKKALEITGYFVGGIASIYVGLKLGIPYHFNPGAMMSVLLMGTSSNDLLFDMPNIPTRILRNRRKKRLERLESANHYQALIQALYLPELSQVSYLMENNSELQKIIK